MSQTSFSIAQMPKTALQAIYNAVTGKTENISKSLFGNVVVTANDIEILYRMMIEQTGLYSCVAEPTVTVVVRDEKHGAKTYSSWARFKQLSIAKKCATSEVGLRLELLLHLPDTPQPQRCVVDINIDSALPVMLAQRKENLSDRALGMFIVFNEKWKTVEVGIDFVDFLVAKAFLNIVEEWFDGLKATPERRFNRFIFIHFDLIRRILDQSGRIGCAVFLMLAGYLYDAETLTFPRAFGAMAVSALVWSAVQILMSSIGKGIFRNLSRNLIPSVIVLDQHDAEELSKLEIEMKSPLVSVVKACSVQFVAIAVNLLASYLWWRYGLK